MSKLAKCWALGGLLACCVAACNQSSPGVASIDGQGGTPVTFDVSLDAQAFSNKKQLTVQIYDQAQLAAEKASAGCNVSYNPATGQTQTQCPPGVTYRPATPEEITLSQEEAAKGLTLRSTTVQVGERYRISISGMAADDCNRASASSEGVAGSATIRLSNLPVAQTEMACMPTR